jgi:hypothetical protein
MSTPTGLRSEALSRRPATPWQLSQGEEAEVMRERMTEFEYIIEYLDENDVARDADTQCFATHAEAERVAEHVLGNGQGRQGARLSRCRHPGTTSLMVSTIRLGEENLVEIFAGWG